MLVVNRFRIPVAEETAFRADLETAHALLAARDGYVDGWIGRNVDEPEYWVLTTRWENAGSYRRALGFYDVRANAWPVLSRAIHEASAYEIVEPGASLNRSDPRSH